MKALEELIKNNPNIIGVKQMTGLKMHPKKKIMVTVSKNITSIEYEQLKSALEISGCDWSIENVNE